MTSDTDAAAAAAVAAAAAAIAADTASSSADAASSSADADDDAAAAAAGPPGVLRLLQAAKQYRAHLSGAGRQQLLRYRDINRALYMGDQERIRSFVRRMAEGQPVTIAILGGSVSKGMGAVAGEPSFEQWLAMWLAAVAPAPRHWSAEAEAEVSADGSGGGGGGGGGWRNSTVRLINAACPATSSAYMNMCLSEYLTDPLVDLVLVEYAINDPAFPEPTMLNEPRKSFEQLLRKLLRLPRRPAVVLLNMYRWFSQDELPPDRRPSDKFYFTNAEAQFFEFATYYGLPLLSVKAAAYQHMVAGERGFQVHTLRYLTRSNSSSDPEALFYEDPMHPSGLTGHRVISELVIGLLLHVARGLVARPWRQWEEELVAAPLPGHMIPDNYDTDLDMCILGDNFKAAAVETQGFTWQNEGRNPLAPKWGYTATEPHAAIAFDLAAPGGADADGRADAATLHSSSSGAGAGGSHSLNSSVLIILAYLRSYEGMGVAAVSCEGGCVCGEDAVPRGTTETPGAGDGSNGNSSGNGRVITRLDGQWEHRNSQLQLGCFPALLTARDCRVLVRVDDVGRTGTNKVKLGGIIVSHTAPEIARALCRENLEAAERAAGYRDDGR